MYGCLTVLLSFSLAYVSYACFTSDHAVWGVVCALVSLPFFLLGSIIFVFELVVSIVLKVVVVLFSIGKKIRDLF